jgi:hypothetical protein
MIFSPVPRALPRPWISSGTAVVAAELPAPTDSRLYGLTSVVVDLAVASACGNDDVLRVFAARPEARALAGRLTAGVVEAERTVGARDPRERFDVVTRQ